MGELLDTALAFLFFLVFLPLLSALLALLLALLALLLFDTPVVVGTSVLSGLLLLVSRVLLIGVLLSAGALLLVGLPLRSLHALLSGSPSLFLGRKPPVEYRTGRIDLHLLPCCMLRFHALPLVVVALVLLHAAR